ncbi:MAG: acyl carrier protein [Myxococcales bacterium]|nr:acyl carrier protein [Myxococcales bacterium]MDD9970212.1 acyl carrier protein [Myxococcales bacterium]
MDKQSSKATVADKQPAEVISRIRKYVANEVLDGKDMGLDENTPLLEWGVLNSLEIEVMIAFLEREFGVRVPPEQVTAENFRNIAAIAQLASSTS